MIDVRFSEAELEQRREHITRFIRDRVDAAGADGVVLGLSGGIDSTLVGHLAVEALGLTPSTASSCRRPSAARGT